MIIRSQKYETSPNIFVHVAINFPKTLLKLYKYKNVRLIDHRDRYSKDLISLGYPSAGVNVVPNNHLKKNHHE